MKKTSIRAVLAAGIAGVMAAAVAVGPAEAHHSFAMYDGAQILDFTGVVVRINPDANHLQIFFAPLNEERTAIIRNEDGSPQIWSVEMAGSAQAAQQGISVNNFPPGTVFSVGLHPLRNSEPGGDRGASGLFKCPTNPDGSPHVPAAGLHCDTVEGNTSHGPGVMPTPGLQDEVFDPDAAAAAPAAPAAPAAN